MLVMPMLLAAVASSAPPGFREVDELTALRHTNDDASPSMWEMRLVDDKPVIETTAERNKRDLNRELSRQKSGKAFVFPHQTRLVTWMPGDGVRVGDGWLFGFAEGEFGGGLWWFSKDGRSHQKISEDNTEAVLVTTKGAFAVEALNHLGMLFYGRLVALERKNGAWTQRTITDLHTSPVVAADGNRFLIATNRYISTLETDGRQREIYNGRGMFEFHVNSLVRQKNGDVWAGCWNGVLRLRPTPAGEYAAQWFLPLK